MIKSGDSTLDYIAQQGCYIYLDNKDGNIDKLSTKYIYTYITKKWKIKPAAGKIKWIEKYDDMNLDDEFWKYIYELPIAC